jgi:hypothetical protein
MPLRKVQFAEKRDDMALQISEWFNWPKRLIPPRE